MAALRHRPPPTHGPASFLRGLLALHGVCLQTGSRFYNAPRGRLVRMQLTIPYPMPVPHPPNQQQPALPAHAAAWRICQLRPWVRPPPPPPGGGGAGGGQPPPPPPAPPSALPPFVESAPAFCPQCSADFCVVFTTNTRPCASCRGLFWERVSLTRRGRFCPLKQTPTRRPATPTSGAFHSQFFCVVFLCSAQWFSSCVFFLCQAVFFFMCNTFLCVRNSTPRVFLLQRGVRARGGGGALQRVWFLASLGPLLGVTEGPFTPDRSW